MSEAKLQKQTEEVQKLTEDTDAKVPSLLAACRRILRSIEWAETADRMTEADQINLLRAVIAKAEGGDQ